MVVLYFVSDLQKYKIGEIKAEKQAHYQSAFMIKPFQLLQILVILK